MNFRQKLVSMAAVSSLGAVSLNSIPQVDAADSKLSAVLTDGVRFYAKKDYKSALGAFDRATKQNDTDLTAWAVKCKTEIRMGRNEDAYTSFRNVNRLQPNLLSAYKDVDEVLPDNDDAPYFRGFHARVIKMYPNDPFGYILLGQYGFHASDKEAVHLAVVGLDHLKSNPADLEFLKAVEAFLSDDLNSGREHVKAALRVDPKHAGANLLNDELRRQSK